MSQNSPIPIDDLFLIWSELRTIAKSVADLLGTDKTKPHATKLQHFKDKVVEWSECYAEKQEARRWWEYWRTAHERRIAERPRFRDEGAGLPEPGWVFDSFDLKNEDGLWTGITVRGWFPGELGDANAPPEPCLPLPPPVDPPTLAERYAALAAIHDCFEKSRQKVDPWARADDDDSISIKGYAAQIAPHARRYDALKDVVEQCEDSELCSWKKDYELSPAQEHSRDTLRVWLDDVREDMPAPQGSAAQGAGDSAETTPASDKPKTDMELVIKDPDNEWPPDSNLHFRPLEFAYQGKIYRLTGMPHRLFEVIATAKKNLHHAEIVERVWTSQERSPERGTVRSCLSDLKGALRKHGLGDLAKHIVVKDGYWSFLD